MLAIFAITLAGLLAVLGLLYSFGFVLAERRGAQTAADAASLSGAWQLLSQLQSEDRSDTSVRTAILSYASSNGVTNASDVAAVYVDASGAALGPVGAGGAFLPTARGVRVTVTGHTSTVLPGFLNATQVLVKTTSAAALKPTASPTSNTLAMPIAVAASDYAPNATVDLFRTNAALGQPAALDLRSAGATDYGPPMSTDLQLWSDGQHVNGTVRTSTDVALATPALASIAAGLQDNIRRQRLHDASTAAYGLIDVPIWSGSGASSVHVVGFARLKIRAVDITTISALATFVPYDAAAYGAPAGGPDYGAAMVLIVP